MSDNSENMAGVAAKWLEWFAGRLEYQLAEAIECEQSSTMRMVDGRMTFVVDADAPEIDEDEIVGVMMSVKDWRLATLNARKTAAFLSAIDTLVEAA